jgi:hypothetical protein
VLPFTPPVGNLGVAKKCKIGTAAEGIAMMTMGAVTARLKAYDRQQRARRAYDASCLALRDGALTGACYLQRDAAKLYAEAQALTKLADEGADANLTDLAGSIWWSPRP